MNKTNNLDFFLDFEGNQLNKILSDRSDNENLAMESISEKIISEAFRQVHTLLINSLINLYMQKKCTGYTHASFTELFIGDISKSIQLPDEIDIVDIPQICELLHVSYLNSIFQISKGKAIRRKSKNNLLEVGAVYTQNEIAYEIVFKTLDNLKTKDPSSLKVLDFATGTGRFYRQIVKCLKDMFGVSPDNSIINNIYAIDIDPIAINICRLNALSMMSRLCYTNATKISEHIILKNGLIKATLFGNETSICNNDLNGIFYNGFDAIVSNPPYLVLKPNKKKMDTDTIENINKMAKYFRESNYYKYSVEGMLNLYQLSLEAMLGMLKTGGEMGIICPSTLFADVSACALRKHLLSRNKVSYIKYFSEDDPLFDNVTQATCIFHLTKGGNSDFIEIVQGNKNYKIALSDVTHVFSSNWEIPSIEKIEWDILRKLMPIRTLKNQKFIRNKRGELDLSLCKRFITKDRTSLRLVRGNMISGNSLIDINHEYVMPEFLESKSQDFLLYDKGRKRLICQQISNMKQRVRLKFVECECNDILGNSCNYISVADEYMPKLKVLLNSALLNWRFKITSTNNHINNYELDELPIIDLDSIPLNITEMDELERNKKVCSLYGLESEEVNFIMQQQYDLI